MYKFLFFFVFSLIFGETKPALKWTLNGAAQTGYIVVDQEWRSSDTADIDYPNGIGVSTNGDALSQRLVTGSGADKVVGSRLYLLDSTQKSYELFKLVGDVEFTYDVDMSQLPCGLNAALYTIEMNKNGLRNDAEYGTGYCDAQFLGMVDGQQVSGCAELDIWEANREATVYTAHSCDFLGQKPRSGGSCDSGGCGYNVHRFCCNQGGSVCDFYGNGAKWQVDTSKKFTVVTQFVGNPLKEIVRKYVQGGKIINMPVCEIWGPNPHDRIDEGFCTTTGHSAGMVAQMGKSLAVGHVLSFSLWDSADAMYWLDSGEYGPCKAGAEDKNDYLEAHYPNATVTWSNVRVGPLDSTYK